MNLLFKITLLLISTYLLPVNAQKKATEESFKILYDRFNMYEGEKVPDCALLADNGEIIQLYELDCEVMILDFWASWCSNCISDFPDSIELIERLKNHGYESIKWISLSVDADTSAWQKTMLRLQVPGSNYLISQYEALEKFHVIDYPSYIILDKNKRILGYDILAPYSGSYMEYFICEAFKGQSAAVSFSKAIDIRDGYCYPSEYFKDWKETYNLTHNE